VVLGGRPVRDLSVVHQRRHVDVDAEEERSMHVAQLHRAGDWTRIH
jgi:hypothetical protein